MDWVYLFPRAMEMVASRGSDNKDRGGDFFLGFSWFEKEEMWGEVTPTWI